MKEQLTSEGPTSSYNEHYKYLLGYAKKLEVAVKSNTPARKANSSKTDYLTPNLPSDSYFSYVSDLSTYTVNQDVDMVQYTLECNQIMKEGRPRPPRRTRQEPICEELKIQNPIWAGLDGDLRKAWSNETNNNKEKIIAQFSSNSKSTATATKNHHLRTVYRTEFEDEDGEAYYFDCTANSEDTYQFNVHSSVYYTTTADDDSNGESVLEGSELNVNVAAARKPKPTSILKGKQKKIDFQGE